MKNMKLQSGFFAGAFFISAFLAWSFARMPASTAACFAMPLPIMLGMIYKCIHTPKIQPIFAANTIFFLLFFYVAPILQISATPEHLINTMPMRVGDIFFANSIVTIFLIFFCVFYLTNQKTRKIVKPTGYSNNKWDYPSTAMMAVAMLVGIWGVSGLTDSISAIENSANSDDSSFLILKHKVLFMVPFVTLCLALVGNKWSKTKISTLTLLILLAAVFATKNPIYDRRNSLGPIYITLLILAYPQLISSTRRIFSVLISVMVFAFPASSMLTHYSAIWLAGGSPDITILGLVTTHFTEPHYDAWSSIIAVKDMVETSGLRWGEQILGTMLFFVPRVLWEGKPISTGFEIGRYLMENYSMWFDNLSATLPAEGYIDFGVLGVILFAAVFGHVCKHMDSMISSPRPIDVVTCVYFSCYIFFFMRGSLLPATAYGVGAFIALRTFPIFIRTIHTLALGRLKQVRLI